MKINILRIIFIFTIALTIFSDYYMVQAAVIKNPIEDMRHYEDNIKIEGEETLLKEKAGKILGLINVIGVVLSVIVLMIIGIKYMVGSIEEKAEYKNAMVPYLIGAVLLFSATTLPNILYNIAQSI